MTITVRTALSRDEVRARIRGLPALLTGRLPDPGQQAQGLLQAVGIEALSILKGAYIVKARGGTDEAGIKWKPLSPRTIAYSRRHPGLNRKRKQAAAQGRASRPLLTKRLDDRWKELFAQTFNAMRRKGIVEGEAKRIAAGAAWKQVKKEGGQTILGKYGNTSVEQLRDTGRLLNSLTPMSGSEDQILEAKPGSVAVGTNVEYAQHVFRVRPLAPPDNRWPQAWTDRLADVLEDGTALILRDLLTV